MTETNENTSVSVKPFKIKTPFRDKNKFTRWLYEHRLGFLIFFLPVFVMYAVYAAFGVHPWGDESVLVLDLNGQYVSYYEAFRDAIWGDGSLIYNWSRNLSGEAFGIFGYYLASPFMWIIVLLPRTMMCGALEIMELAKVGSCAVAFAYYLKKSKNAKPSTQVIFSFIYALMTYIVVELMNPMWIDGMILLPIILLGIEELVDKGKMLRLLISLSVMFFVHFYIGYMIGFFSAIYFIYYNFSRPGHAVAPNFFKSCGKFFITAVVSVMNACIVLIPVYNSLKLGKLEFSTPDFTPKAQFDIWQFLSKLFPLTYDTVRPEGLPMIACGTLVLMLVPLFFLNRRIKMKEKVSSAILLLVIFASMYISTIDIAWHGFQVPNWLPYRYSFTFSFILIVMAARAFENIRGVTIKEIGLTFFSYVVLVFFLETRAYAHFVTFGAVWVSVFILAVYFALLYIFRKHRVKGMAALIMVFVMAETFASSLYTICCIDSDVVYSRYSSYQDYFKDGREVVSQIKEADDGLFRMEKTFHRTVNDPIGMNFAGLSHSSSTMNTPVLLMLKSLGFVYQGHSTKYTGSTLITDAVFGVKYLMHKEDEIVLTEDEQENNRLIIQNELKLPHSSYQKIMTPDDTGVDDIDVYENPYALPIGFAASTDILSVTLDSDNAFDNQNALLNGLVGKNKDGRDYNFFNSLYMIDYTTENVTTSIVNGDHTKYTVETAGRDAYVEMSFTPRTDDVIYLYMPTLWQRQLNLWIKAENWDVKNYPFLTYYYEGENYCIATIGEPEPGVKFSIRMTLAKDEAYIKDKFVVQLDTDLFEEKINELQNGGWNIEEHSATHIKGDVTIGEGQLFFTTIPYEPGWNITVDGKKVEPVKALDSLIAIEMEPGTHTVEMTFFPGYFTAGIIVTLIGLAFTVIIAVFPLVRKKTQMKVPVRVEIENKD